MNPKLKKALTITAITIPGLFALLYFGGLAGQLLENYRRWMDAGGMTGQAQMGRVSWNPGICFAHAFTGPGLVGMGVLLAAALGIFSYVKLHDRFGGKDRDERGFSVTKNGLYGTAAWMSDKEMREVLEVSSVETAEGTILGESHGKVVCMPKDTRLNRHIAIFGASGTMKTRAVVRNALFQTIRRGESVVVTYTKGELYADTAELYRQNGYDVKVFNLVSPAHGDSWNCMSDLQGDTLMAHVLTNVIIGNTSSGKGDHFWDNGEANLLKALVLFVDQDRTRDSGNKHLPAVYQMLTQYSERQLTALFAKLPLDHPARAPFALFSQSSDTVRSGIVLGLGTRLQVLQDQAVQRITSQSDIDLTAPGKRKCAYFIILSDQDASMAFLSSLFFSFLFIKLTRYADSNPSGRCAVPVNLIFDEFNNVGRIGGAADGSDFTRALSTIRSRDIRVMLAVQSLGQLQNRYGNNLWAEIIGNCDIQLMLGCTDDVSAEYFSARSGDISVEVNSTMTVRKTIAIAQIIPQYRHTEGQGKRRLLTPDEVLRLPNSELLCIIRGCNILKLKKYDYIKSLFLMPGGMKPEGLKAAGYEYNQNRNKYPFQCYINWQGGDNGNILHCDEKFVTLLYECFEDCFEDVSLVRDAGNLVKADIYNFLADSGKAIMVVDCENSDPVKLAAALSSLSPASKAKVSKILLFDSEYTTASWGILAKAGDFSIEHVTVLRLNERKSQVDMTLATRTCKEVYTNGVDSVILVSSDSDYWALIQTLADIDFLVMVERRKSGNDILNALEQRNIVYCFLDDFCTNASYTIKTETILQELRSRLDAALSVNINEMLDDVIHNTWVQMTPKEKQAFYDRYIKTARLALEPCGNLKIVIDV